MILSLPTQLLLNNNSYINLNDATRSPFMTFRDNINFRMFQSSDGSNTLYGFGIARGTDFTGSGVVYCGYINNNSNCKWGFRTHRPEAALHVNATMKANQYQNARNAEFDGAFFSSPTDGITFKDRMVAEDYMIVDKAIYTKAISSPPATTFSTYETAAAKAIKAAFTKYTADGKTKFGIDTQTLEGIFTNNGLTIGDYDIIKTVTLDAITVAGDGSGEVGEHDRVWRASATTYKSIDYQALFAFIISSLPDFDSLESRISALESA